MENFLFCLTLLCKFDKIMYVFKVHTQKVAVNKVTWRVSPPRKFKEVLSMKVVYSNGSEGTLSAKDSEKLYLQDRFTLESWQELESEMVRLGIIKFEDPFLSTLGADLVSIEYVRNQVAAH